MAMEKEDALHPEDATSVTNLSQVEPSIASLTEEDVKHSHETVASQSSYQIKPGFQERFKEVNVKEIIQAIQYNTLSGKTYDPDSAKKWTMKMSNEINERVKDLKMKRYRHIVQVVLGERKGQGIKSGVRCVWDSEIDTYCHDIFINDTIFCVVTVFAVFLY